MVRAIRGAITVEENNYCEIIDATKEILEEIVNKNDLNQDDIISVIFSVTKDLDAAFPAVAARQLGWTDVALMCTNEIQVPGSLEKCIRALVHINSDKNKNEIKHIYLKGARALRTDLESE